MSRRNPLPLGSGLACANPREGHAQAKDQANHRADRDARRRPLPAAPERRTRHPDREARRARNGGCSPRSTATTRSSSCTRSSATRRSTSCSPSCEELEVIEDAADDERLGAGELERFDRQLRYFSDIARRRADRLGVPGAAARGEGRRARRRRARRLGGLGARLLRRRRDVADRRRPGRGQQPQPPDPLHRGRHRPAEGRVRGGAAAGLQLGDRRSRPRRAGSRARRRSPTSSPAPTSSSTPPTGPPTTSSAGATPPASKPASPTSR